MTEQRAPDTSTGSHSIAPAAEAAASAEASALSKASRDAAAGPLAHPFRWLSIGMYAIIFLAAFESLAVTTVMPTIARELDGVELFALAFAVPLGAGIVGMVIAGNWTDRSGPLPPLLASGGLFAVGVLIAGSAPNMLVFIAGRLVHGLAGAAVIVPLYVIVGRLYPEAIRARVFAGFAAAWVIPSIVGPAVAGVIAESVGWRWVFLGVLGLLVPCAAMLLRPLLRTRAEIGGDPSVAWSASRLGWAVVTAASALALSVAPELPQPWRWVVAAAAIVVIVVAVRPLMPAGTVRAARGMPATVLARLVVAAAFFGTEVYLPYFLSEEYGLRASLAGAVLTGAGVSWASASWLQGRLGDRVSNVRAVQIGSAVLALALATVLAVALFGWPPAVVFVAWTFAGAGMGFMYPRFSVTVLRLSPPSQQGFNGSALTLGEALGATVGIAATALVASAAAGGSFAPEFAVTVAIAAVAVVVAPRVRPAKRV